METSKKFSLQKLLNNQKALMVISFLLALIVWITISLNEAPEIERVVEHVKVTIDDSVPNQLGYEAFGADDLYIDITVKGKRYLVGDNVLTADDFTVTAITTHVDAPGSYTLQLKATSKDIGTNYVIVSKSQDYVDVYFDTPKTTEVAVDADVVCKSKNLLYSNDYITEDPILSVSKISVTGPATVVDKIKHAVASVTTSGNLKSTETLHSEVKILDNYGTELKYLKVSENIDDITVTIPVYKIVDLPVSVGFSNSPIYYIDNPLTIVCAPTKIQVAADETKLETLNNITLGTVDFSDLNPGLNTFEFDTTGIKDALPIDKSSKYVVYINTGNVVKTTFTIEPDNISFSSNEKEKYSYKVTSDALEVTLVGPQENLSKLTADNITATINLSKQNISEGKNTVPITIRVKDDNCWVYGKYTVDILATKK